MIIYIDIDETICESPKDRDYSLSVPIEENIEKANKLYDEGNTIVYWTARGTVSGTNWEETTRRHLKLGSTLVSLRLLPEISPLVLVITV